jgi:hypothetical protein
MTKDHTSTIMERCKSGGEDAIYHYRLTPACKTLFWRPVDEDYVNPLTRGDAPAGYLAQRAEHGAAFQQPSLRLSP